MKFVFFAIVAGSFLLTSTPSQAAPAYSWDLARELAARGNSTNPITGGVWTLMYDQGGTTHNQVNYVALPAYSATLWPYGGPVSNWSIPGSSTSVIGVLTGDYTVVNGPNTSYPMTQGDVYVHPDVSKATIVKWRSPVSGKVTVSGAISDLDGSCGNGVRWFLDKGNVILMNGTVQNGNHGMSFVQQNIPVAIGTSLYFVVDSNGQHECDMTRLDFLVTSP